MPAISGAATLVPPNTNQAELLEFAGPKTATPVLGSATAETSATVRREQPVSVCQDCFASYAEQPLPAPLQAVSVQPRPPVVRLRVVPPTAVTYREAAGYSTP